MLGLQLEYPLRCYHVSTYYEVFPEIRHWLVRMLHVMPIGARPDRSLLVREPIENIVDVLLVDAVPVTCLQGQVNEIAALVVDDVVVSYKLVATAPLNYLVEAAVRFLRKLVYCHTNLSFLEEIHFRHFCFLFEYDFVEVVFAVEHAGLKST